MSESIVAEGRTTNEAIEKGLKILKTKKENVEIKVLEQEDKRSFFSILTPRVVKVEMKLKENFEEKENEPKKIVKTEKISTEELQNCMERLKIFLDEFISKLPNKDLNYEMIEDNGIIKIEIKGEDTGYLIGYRGEVLNSIQTVISNIASKSSKEKIRVQLNIGGYREKREKDLQILATKIAGTVIRTKKEITLEPMPAYERKIIHTKLQENSKVTTHSVGEEPYRKIVVSLKK